jgi:hypothetical protein
MESANLRAVESARTEAAELWKWNLNLPFIGIWPTGMAKRARRKGVPSKVWDLPDFPLAGGM